MTDNPFAGLQRRRLPGMHMSTALDGGAPLYNMLAAFFFTILHDQLPHRCLVKKHEEELQQATDEARRSAQSLEGMTLANVFGGIASTNLYGEEWSYIDDEETVHCLLLAGAAIEQTQRWICAGVEEPKAIPLGPLVCRPAWAPQYYAEHGDIEAREYVERVQHEVAEAVAQAR